MRPSQQTTGRRAAAAVLWVASAGLALAGPHEIIAQGDWAGVLPREFRAASMDHRPAQRPWAPRVGIIGTIIDVPPAQPPVPARVRVIRVSSVPDETGGSGLLIQADRRLVQALRHAQDLVEKQNYIDACRQFQGILEAAQDGFFHPDATQDALHRSLKAETLRIIGDLPPAGREVYRNQYAPAADALLADAVRTDDFTKLGEVARLYFHTPAGHEAAYRLGSHALDRHEPLAAALYFDRLRQIPEAAERWEPLLSLRSAQCWYLTGMPAVAREILVEIAAKHDPATIRAGGQPLPAFGAAGGADGWLVKAFGPVGEATPASGTDWGLFRGDPSRSAVVAATAGTGEPAAVEPWQADAIIPIAEAFEPTDGRLHEALRTAVEAQRRGYDNRQRPVLPRLSPLIVGDRIVARTSGNVVSLDARTGDRLQETLEDDGYAGLIEQWEHGGLANASGVLSQLVSQRIWNDGTYGGLSSDGRLVFAVEESGVVGMPPVPSVYSGFAVRDSNLLRAYDADSGHISWERGGPADEFALPLAGTFFLGAPLPLAGRLFAIAEENGEVRLLVLNPADGALDWEQPLASTVVNIQGDARRRTAGVSPSYADGVLVCPTGAGSVVALDLMTRSLLWAYQTSEPHAVGPVPIRRGRANVRILNQVPQRSGWLDDVAIISGRYVLLTPGDSDELHCLDLLDGALRWTRPRGEALYVAGVAGGAALLVGPDRVRAVRLDEGAELWEQPAQLAGGNQATVSGRGFLQGGRLHLPLSTAEIAVVEVVTGNIVSRTATPDGHVPGNLVSARGLVVSQNAEHVAVFGLPAARDKVAAAR